MRWTRARSWSWALPALVAVLPCAMAAIRALRADWLPIGDNGYFAVRARDVLTEHHPLLGAWSSGSQVVGVDVNNLGPLQLDLLWPFVELLGLGPGTIVGVTLVNGLCAAGVVVLAYRRAGEVGAWLGAATAAALSWTLGSELLLEPRQHHALVLPFLLCLVLAWCLADGDVALLPLTALAATYVAQTHLTFLVPLGAVLVVSLVAMVRRLREPPDRAEDTPAVRGSVLVTIGLLAVLWAQTVVEQLDGGEGNLTSVWEAARAETEEYGLAAGTRTLADITRPLVGWLPPSFGDFDPNGHVLSAPAAALTLALLGGGLVAIARLAHRRGDRTVTALVLVVAAALVSGWYAVVSSPEGMFGVLASNFRWLWPIGAVSTFALALGVARLAAGRHPGTRVVLAAATVAVTVAVWALPASHQGSGPRDGRALIEVSRQLLDQLHDLELDGTVVIDRRGTYFGEPFSYVLFAALQDRGIDFESALPQDARRFGEKRAYDGTADGTLTLVTGVHAEAARPGSRRLAFGSWLTDAERSELVRLTDAAEAGTLSSDEQARQLELRHRRAVGTVAVWFSEGTPADLEPTRPR
jgi:hypothetical protein